MKKKNILYLLLFTILAGCGSPSSFEPNGVVSPTSNFAPTATAQSVILNENSTKAIILSGIDPDGDVLTYVITAQPTNGIFLNGVYTPTANYYGSDSFKFEVNDGSLTSAPAIVSITITPNTSKICKQPLKTGQIIPYHNNDDGDLQKGATRNYIRDDVNQIVADNVTNLMWQDNESIQKPWITQLNFDAKNYNDISGETATVYCQNLELGGHIDWRLPDVEELLYIVDRGRKNPTLNPVFKSRDSNYYWSSTIVVNSSNQVWVVRFDRGDDGLATKNNEYYVRCVRAIMEKIGNIND